MAAGGVYSESTKIWYTLQDFKAQISWHNKEYHQTLMIKITFMFFGLVSVPCLAPVTPVTCRHISWKTFSVTKS